jgi:hypothetical protein
MQFTHTTHLESAAERCQNDEAVMPLQTMYTTHIPMDAIIKQRVSLITEAQGPIENWQLRMTQYFLTEHTSR